MMVNSENHHRATLVQEIAHIQFLKLTHLVLWGNRLDSLETLVQIHMPLLQELDLCIPSIIQILIASVQLDWGERLDGLVLRTSVFVISSSFRREQVHGRPDPIPGLFP